MKKWLWLLLPAVLLLGRVEHTGTDISGLDPVELVRVTVSDGVTIETDTGAVGVGSDLEEAVADLHASSPKTVFLDTAQYLLLSGGAEDLLPQLYELLRPACRVCIGQGEMDLTEAAAYLNTHSPKTRLLDWGAGEYRLQTLYYKEGRGRLVSGTD